MDITHRSLITTPITDAILKGAAELEATAQGWLPHRLPAWARRQSSDPQLLMAESQPAGVRLVFQSRATQIELDVLPTRRVYAGLPGRPASVYDLVVDGELMVQGKARRIAGVTGRVLASGRNRIAGQSHSDNLVPSKRLGL